MRRTSTRKSKGKSRTDNPETRATLGTRHRAKTRQKTVKGKSRTDNPETHATLGTRHRTKTRQRTVKGKSRTDNPETHATLGTRHRTKTNKTTTQQQKQKINSTDFTKTRRWTKVLAKGKQLLFAIKHPPFRYIRSLIVIITANLYAPIWANVWLIIVCSSNGYTAFFIKYHEYI